MCPVSTKTAAPARLTLGLDSLEDRLLLSYTAPGLLYLVSSSAALERADGPAGTLAVSADGRYVAFDSVSGDLVAGDTNGVSDVFVCDRQTETVRRVSVSSAGDQANGGSWVSAISADGRYVTFHSDATDLVLADTNGRSDVFVYDCETGAIERVSVSSTGAQAKGSSYSSDISADGRYVAFYSYANNLAAGDTNGQLDVFVYDRTTDIVERVSVSSAGEQGNSFSQDPDISADGRYVAFHSKASNLVPGDTNDTRDVFVYDRDADTIQRVSVSSAGGQADGWSAYASISADGRYVAFHSTAGNLVAGDANGNRDVYVYDLKTGAIELVSLGMAGGAGNNWSAYPDISADGRYVAFHSSASDLVPGDMNGCRDVFVYDRQTGAMERVSVSSAGEETDRYSESAAISADGRYVAFLSAAGNLMPPQGVGGTELKAFLYDRLAAADLEAVSASGPASVAVNTAGAVSVQVTNAGIKAAGGFTVGLYLSADGVYDAGDLLVGTATVSRLTPGAVWSGSVSYDLSATAGEGAGQHYWVARADILGEVAEADEGNNWLAGNAVSVLAPRYIGAISGPHGATVSVYDMDVSGPVDVSLSDLDVRFESNGTIRSITLTGGNPMSGLGLFITGTPYVDQIKDARGAGRADIAVIASQAAIGSVHAKTNVTGSVIGGLTLGGMTFPLDVDGDGLTSDATSLYSGGSIGRINVQGQILGDVVTGQGGPLLGAATFGAKWRGGRALRRARL